MFFLCGFFVFISGGVKGLADMLFVYRNPFSRTFYLNKDSQLRDRLCCEKGVLFGEIYNDFITRSRSYKLSDDDKKEIRDHLTKMSIGQSTVLPISGENPASGKNLIFIIVESYLSYTGDLSFDGKEVTPYLNKIRKTEGVYFNGKMRTNIALGQSFDGQFIYMTGLLPLTAEISAPRVYNQILPSLPRQLKSDLNSKPFKTSVISIATPAYTWFQNKMSPVYDIDKLYAMEKDGQDGDLFGQAQNVDLSAEYPFFHMSVTMSMHVPYNSIHFSSCDPESFEFPENYSDEIKNYLISCNYTDKCIENYLESLREKGIFDDSVIVIASDHNLDNAPLNFSDTEAIKYIPFYVINSGRDLSQCFYGEINQIDVFTSLLDLYGIHDTDWRGFGSSIWNADTYTDNWTPENIVLSAKIIEGEYLNITE